MSRLSKATMIAIVSFAIFGCKPAEPPVDLVKTQRDALNQAKAVEGQLQQQADAQKKAIDDAQK